MMRLHREAWRAPPCAAQDQDGRAHFIRCQSLATIGIRRLREERHVPRRLEEQNSDHEPDHVVVHPRGNCGPRPGADASN